jgi:superfamily II DNA/RNA helicase
LLLDASVLACTAPEMMALVLESGAMASAIDAALADLRLIVLDEMDSLLPTESFRGPRAQAQRKAANKKADEPAAQALLRHAIELCSRPDLQLLAASATVSRPSRAKLGRILRRDPLGRWFGDPPAVIRPPQLAEMDLTRSARAVAVPSAIRHTYARLPVRVAKLAHKGSVAHARQGGEEAAELPAAGKRSTLKQKRRIREAIGAAAAAAERERATHPLVAAVGCAVAEQRPSSALVFLCRSSGLTVRKAVKQMRALGMPAQALHEAIGLEAGGGERQGRAGGRAEAEAGDWWEKPEYREGAGRVSLRGGGGRLRGVGEEDLLDGTDEAGGATGGASLQLQERQRALAATFRDRAGLGGAAGGAGAAESPLVVTFEDMARGLHFDGVEVVYILGLPDSPATYLHLAGRTGRQPVLNGTVLTICSGNAHTQLCGWASRLGEGVVFEEVRLEGMAEAVGRG